MGKKTTKTVKVDQSTAKDWDEYVIENAHIDSVSHLIRLAVQREIKDDHIRTKDRSEPTDEAVSGEVLTTLRQIKTGIGDLEERLSSLEQVEKEESSYDLKKAIYGILPSDEHLKSPIGTVNEIPKPEDPEDLSVVSANDIAQKLGADIIDVESALNELVENTSQIQRSDKNHDGNHYWKKSQ